MIARAVADALGCPEVVDALLTKWANAASAPPDPPDTWRLAEASAAARAVLRDVWEGVARVFFPQTSCKVSWPAHDAAVIRKLERLMSPEEFAASRAILSDAASMPWHTIDPNTHPTEKKITELPGDPEPLDALCKLLVEEALTGAVRILGVDADESEILGLSVLRLFVVRSSKKWRVIHDARPENEHMREATARYDSVLDALEVPRGWLAVKLDLQSAFKQVRVCRRDARRLGFAVRRPGSRHLVAGAYVTLPFGVSHSPDLFLSAARPAIILARSEGVRLVWYMDDILILAPDAESLAESVRITVDSFAKFGVRVSPSKFYPYAASRLDFLGLDIDFARRILALTDEKRRRIFNGARNLFKAGAASRKQLEEFLGLVSFSTVAAPSLAFLRSGLNAALWGGTFADVPEHRRLPLAQDAMDDLEGILALPKSAFECTWDDALARGGRTPPSQLPPTDIWVDSSDTMWAAVREDRLPWQVWRQVVDRPDLTPADALRIVRDAGCEDAIRTGTFSEKESAASSTFREILGIARALVAFDIPGPARVFCDSMSGVRTARTRYPRSPLMHPAVQELARALRHRAPVRFEWTRRDGGLIPLCDALGKTDASDGVARRTAEWSIDPHIFFDIQVRWGVRFELDAFASWRTNLTPAYGSRTPDGRSLGNAFDLDWSSQPTWLSPPWSLGAQALRKVVRDQVPLAAITVRLQRGDQTRLALASLRASRAVRVLKVAHLGTSGSVSAATGRIPGASPCHTAVVLISASPVAWHIGPQAADGDGLKYVPGPGPRGGRGRPGRRAPAAVPLPPAAGHDGAAFAREAQALLLQPPAAAAVPSVALVSRIFREYHRTTVVSWSALGAAPAAAAAGAAAPPPGVEPGMQAWADAVNTIASTRASNTHRTYRRVAGLFANWLDSAFRDPAATAWTPAVASNAIGQFCLARTLRRPPPGAPAAPRGVCTGVGANTVKTEFECIRAVLSLADLPVSLSSASNLRHLLRRIGALDKRRRPARPAFTLNHLQQIQAAVFPRGLLDHRVRPKNLRDFACCHVTFAFCQRSEVSTALHMRDVRLTVKSAMRLAWRRASKTDQDRHARPASGFTTMSAVRPCRNVLKAWLAWLPRDWTGSLFPRMRASHTTAGGPWIPHRGVWLHGTDHVSNVNINNAIRGWCSLADIREPLTMHCLRVGMATTLFDLGQPMEVIRRLGQWASDAVRVYLRVQDGTLLDATRRVGDPRARSSRVRGRDAGSAAPPSPPRKRARLRAAAGAGGQ